MSFVVRFFGRLPLRRKLVASTMIVATGAVLLACFGFSANEVVAFRRTASEELTSTAALVAYSASAALSFEDKAATQRLLQALSSQADVRAGIIYDREGATFAAYRRAASTQPLGNAPKISTENLQFDGRLLKLSQPILASGERIGTLYVESDLSALRLRLERYLLIVLAVLGVTSAVAYGLSRGLMTSISAPVSHLAGVISQVSSSQDYSVRATKYGSDEIGDLIDGFNRMLAEIQSQKRALESFHERLLAASRLAGRAEVATNVLHNVGNVLNSVMVAASLAMERTRRSHSSDLETLAALLTEEENLVAFASSDSGRHLPSYLAELSKAVRANEARVISELETLHRHVEHIREIVAMQQRYSRRIGVAEPVDLKALVEDSVRMDGTEFSRHGIEVLLELDDVPPVVADRHALLQILVNLVRNARHACEESTREDRCITVKLKRDEDEVAISVFDNGVGIAAENLDRIFSFGFTTRTSGHGFGLHGSALAARHFGGALTVKSDGLGQGASFTLHIPLAKRDPAHVS